MCEWTNVCIPCFSLAGKGTLVYSFLLLVLIIWNKLTLENKSSKNILP
jgi:hypothetical protein